MVWLNSNELFSVNIGFSVNGRLDGSSENSPTFGEKKKKIQILFFYLIFFLSVGGGAAVLSSSPLEKPPSLLLDVSTLTENRLWLKTELKSL